MAASSRIRLDLNSPDFQDAFLHLDPVQLRQVVAALRKIGSLDWATLYRHTGFQWEAVRHIRTPNGATAYSFRLSQKVRAIAYRDGDFLCIVSLHPDHDSAYER